MNVWSGNFNTAQTGLVIAEAVPETLIRIHRVIITGWTGVNLTLLSDPGGAHEEALACRLRATSGSIGVYDFSGRFALGGGKGKGVGLTAAYQGAGGEYSLTVFWERVG